MRLASRRSTSNRDARGSAEDRRRRRQWLVDEFGDGELVACHMRQSPHCLWILDVDTVSPDRFPISGSDGGTYRRTNIRPGCPACQCHQGGELGPQRRAERRPLR